jgi:hypothetical protein
MPVSPLVAAALVPPAGGGLSPAPTAANAKTYGLRGHPR